MDLWAEFLLGVGGERLSRVAAAAVRAVKRFRIPSESLPRCAVECSYWSLSPRCGGMKDDNWNLGPVRSRFASLLCFSSCLHCCTHIFVLCCFWPIESPFGFSGLLK